jgi:hypothetical protein
MGILPVSATTAEEAVVVAVDAEEDVMIVVAVDVI